MPEPVPARLSATILLLRDGGSGLEVFMVERHHQIEFATGALVFPGGKVDPGDVDARLWAHCQGIGGLDEEARCLRVAAIRETFEESGVLLARRVGEEALVPCEQRADIDQRRRDDLHAGRTTMAELLEAERLVLACDRLQPFAHWITPEFMPKRFDTWFFLAEAPKGQLALHDGQESVDSLWVRPADAVAAARAGRRTIIFPTLMNLQKLGRSNSVAEALRAARQDRIVTVFPRVEKRDGEMMMVLPEDAGYDVVAAPLDAVR